MEMELVQQRHLAAFAAVPHISRRLGYRFSPSWCGIMCAHAGLISTAAIAAFAATMRLLFETLRFGRVATLGTSRGLLLSSCPARRSLVAACRGVAALSAMASPSRSAGRR